MAHVYFIVWNALRGNKLIANCKPVALAECAASSNLVSDMIEKTISEIEAKISGADSVSTERKQELLKLLGTLKTEIAKLSKTHGEQADSIAGFAQLSTHEATRTEPNPQLRELSLQGLRSSVEDIEQSHPRLAQIVNSISKTLSDLGI
jgi:Mg2+ and Co2+ transporter CorA